MPRFPLLGRLYSREYFALIAGFLFIGFESVLRLVIFFLPNPVIDWFYRRSRELFDEFVYSGPVTVASAMNPSPSSGVARDTEEEAERADEIMGALDFEALCEIYGYEHEEHAVLTKDGYLLGLHRILGRKGNADTPSRTYAHKGPRRGRPVVYLHHGLLMCSDVFLCTTSEERSLPLMLAEAGYDVWLGNNRGNKYSKKHISLHPHSSQFWNYSLDEFAWRDIPDSIEYVLEVTGEKSLSYVGFSQGSAQAFAALSICPALNDKINLFVALAPAIAPPGLSAPIVDGLMKSSPALMYLFFGRRSILSSATLWQSILYPPIFASLIDISLKYLFHWLGRNITPAQKLAGYAHLYSFASTKSVVHWFQIMRNAEFQMYDEDVQSSVSPSAQGSWSVRFYYRPARFPTRNISSPVVLLYGDKDSLVDIDVMKRQLPAHAVAKPLRGYEHLDILWGENVHVDVIPEVLEALQTHARRPESMGEIDEKPKVNGTV